MPLNWPLEIVPYQIFHADYPAIGNMSPEASTHMRLDSHYGLELSCGLPLLEPIKITSPPVGRQI